MRLKTWMALAFGVSLFFLAQNAHCQVIAVTEGQKLASPQARAALAATYYVAPNGSDSNPGSLDAPWATPGFGSRQLAPGDTLVILGGRYVQSEYDAHILMPTSGTASAWVNIRGEEGNRPVLAGRDNLITAIDLSGISYVRVENLEITHDDTASGEGLFFRDGVDIAGRPASHIVLQDLFIHHVDSFGINFQDVDDLSVVNCRIEYCGDGAMGGPEAEYGGWQNVRIERCHLSFSGHYYQGGDGSDRPYDRPDGFGVEPSNGPIAIVDTVAEHNYGDGLDSKPANTTIQRCIVGNNSCDGIKLWGDNSRVENTVVYGRGDGDSDPTYWSAVVLHTEQPNASFSLVNLTVDDTLGGNYIMHVQYDYPTVPTRLTMRNCIFRGIGPSSHLYVASGVLLTSDHNLFYLPQADWVLEHGDTFYSPSTISSLGAGNKYGDPRFVFPAWGSPGNYHLRAGSPAINAGSADGAPSNDLEGRRRDAQPDIGAYEYWVPRGWVWLPLIVKGWR